MMEFSLSIDLGKKERVKPTDRSMPVDRAFVAQSLIALAAKIPTGKDSRGTILDEADHEVGGWQFSIKLGG